jgi:outer membrane protein
LTTLTTRTHVDAPNADAFLLLSMPIYDGGVRDAQLRAAQAQASAAASELVVASKITAAVARDYYDHGLGTLTDATSAQTALLQAEFAKAKARSDALTAAATIAFASGALTNRDTLGAR